MYDFGHAYVDTHSFLPYDFLKFQKSQKFSGSYNFVYIYFLIYLFAFMIGKFFTLKKPYFSIPDRNYSINFSAYLRALANLGCQ